MWGYYTIKETLVKKHYWVKTLVSRVQRKNIFLKTFMPNSHQLHFFLVSKHASAQIKVLMLEIQLLTGIRQKPTLMTLALRCLLNPEKSVFTLLHHFSTENNFIQSLLELSSRSSPEFTRFIKPMTVKNPYKVGKAVPFQQICHYAFTDMMIYAVIIHH